MGTVPSIDTAKPIAGNPVYRAPGRGQSAATNPANARSIGAPGYRLVHWIGTSGTATVYAATELSSGRQAAVKVFHPLSAAGLAQLEQRLRENARLSHPNIVPIREIGRTADGRLFYSMPLLSDFERARHALRSRPLRIAALLRELLDGLGYAHQCGAVHAYIKPANVLFDEHGRALLADFGIARCIAELNLLHVDAAGYLSPEQAQGEVPSPRSDIYGIGLLAYELLTGTLPAEGRNNALAPVAAQAGQTVPRLPPRAIAWQVWIDRALAAAPERRFQTTDEMALALGGIDGNHGGSHAVAFTRDKGVPKRIVSALAFIAAIVALAVWAFWGNGEAPAPAVEGNTVSAPETVETPAPPMVASQVPPAPPSTVSPLAARVRELVAAADVQRAQGHLFSPPPHNAASQYLAALALDPGNLAATAGIDAMLTTLRGQLKNAWRRGRSVHETVTLLKQGDTLARYADVPGVRTWVSYRRHLADQVGEDLMRAERAHDTQKIAALQPLAKALPVIFPVGLHPAKAERVATSTSVATPTPVAATPAAGQHMRDPGGPLLVYVPASGHAPAFAIARVEVTRADYARFVRATHQPAAECRAAHNPFSRFRGLSWRAPGFAQGGDYPVVCVSWNDAAAYAAWLSKTTGEPYRLPSSGQWFRTAHGMPKGDPCQLGNIDDVSRHNRFDDDRWSCNDRAAYTAPVGHYAPSGVGAYDMYGNVSEWLAGGSPGSRLFRGLSWRDGSHQTPFGGPGTADSDVGYTSVGFRVVRVIDSAHPAPPAVSGH